MEFIQTQLDGVILIKPQVFGDERGFFSESYKKSVFNANGIFDEFNQDNNSNSQIGVLRGLHYQILPHPQAKLVRCVRGKIFDVAVDVRPTSKNFGKYFSVELSGENGWMLYIPAGFAHGFLALENNSYVSYKTSSEYAKACERGIIYNDERINIAWPAISNEYIISAKDQVLPSLETALSLNNYLP